MGDAVTATLPNFTTQDAATYKAAIDGGFAIADRLAWAFAPHEQATPDMTVRLAAGAVFDGDTLSEVAAQSSATITAPTTDPRIDRVVIDRATGAVSMIAGAEAASPTPPAIAAGKAPVAQVALTVGQTEIVNADITDERDLRLLGPAADGSMLFAVATGSANAYAVTLSSTAAYAAGQTVRFKANHDNTGAATLDVNGLGAKAIKKADGATDLEAGDIVNGLICEVAYDGASFLLISPENAGLGRLSVAATWTAGQRAEVTTLTDGATITPDFDDSNDFTVTLGGNRTLANPSNATAGQAGSIFVVQDGTGSRTLSFGANWKFAGGAAPTLSTTANAIDRIDYVVKSASEVHAVASLDVK